MLNCEVVSFTNDEVRLDVNVSPSEDTVWLTLEQIGTLFDRDRSVIGKHIRNIYKEGELEEKSTRANFAQVQTEGKREITREVAYYNLDVIISVGYRVKSKNGVLFRKWANNVLKDYLLKGYVINDKRTLVTNENYINLINRVDSIDNRLSLIEKTETEKERVFFDGEIFDPKSFISELISKARDSIILVDAYADIKALDFLKHKRNGVKLSIYHSSKAKLSKKDVADFNQQYGGCVTFINDNYHDRFLILDSEEMYHLGASLNYAGKKTFAITKMEDKYLIESIERSL